MIKRMIIRLIASPNIKNLFYVFGFGHLMDVSEKLKKKILITLIEKEILLA